MHLGTPIALGRTAEIYAWKDGYIIKLFRDWMTAASVEYEAQVARAVHAARLPVPAVGEVVEINGRLGLVYERVEGMSMLETWRTKPWTLFRFARLLAELHADMHACTVPELPSQRQRLENRIRGTEALSADMMRAVLTVLDEMSDGERLCHGDFHPDNILMTAQGPVIIDWMDATRGNPLSDVARTSLLFRVAALPPGTPARWLIEAMRHWFHAAYLKRYFQLRPGDRRQLVTWQPVIAAARLGEDITEERDRLIALVKAGLSGYG